MLMIIILLVVFIYVLFTSLWTVLWFRYYAALLKFNSSIFGKKDWNELSVEEMINIYKTHLEWEDDVLEKGRRRKVKSELPYYDMNDALSHIVNETGLDESIIKKILNSESRYMEKVGITKNPIMYEES